MHPKEIGAIFAKRAGKAIAQDTAESQALKAVYGYLEEKGIEFGWNRHLIPERVYFKLYKVPAQFYHEVLIPGFRDVCSRQKFTIHPDEYIKEENNCRTFIGTLKWKGG